MKFLIAGLGNIGSEYEDTRHNIGFMALDALAKQHEAAFELDRHAFTATIRHKGKQIVLIKPTTYMNLSGKAVRYHLDKHSIAPSNLLVITDDLALPFGKLRLRGKGSAGGHNGLKNIEELLHTQEYPRLRVGIGDEFSKGKQVNYVLGKFSTDEQAGLPLVLERCGKAVLGFATIDLPLVMNEVNR